MTTSELHEVTIQTNNTPFWSHEAMCENLLNSTGLSALHTYTDTYRHRERYSHTDTQTHSRTHRQTAL